MNSKFAAGVSLASCANFEDTYVDEIPCGSDSIDTIAVQPGQTSTPLTLTPDYFWSPGNSGEISHLTDNNSILIDIKHVRQLYHWDCGVACVQMLLSHIGYEYSAGELLNMVGTRSVWTIDLAFLLRKACYELCFLFCSRTLDVEESHSELEMYQKEFDADAMRCRNLFATAQENSVCCLEVSLEMSELAKLMLAGRVVLIVLIDITKINKSHINKRYTGHYILICGYDSVSRDFSYLDPAQTAAVRTISDRQLEEARCCEGTDEDLIIIEVPKGAGLLTQEDVQSPSGLESSLEGLRRSAYEASDHLLDSADTWWHSMLSGLSVLGRQEDEEGNEFKIL